MKKSLLALGITLALALCSTAALAESIKGRVGVTGLMGFHNPADSEMTFGGRKNVDTDLGFGIGGGVIYGLDKNIALEFMIHHTDFDGAIAGVTQGNFDSNTYAFGMQYRFDNLHQRLTPYVGAGLDVFSTDFTATDGTKADIDTTFGVHLSGGLDYFITKQVALTSEVRLTVAPDADIAISGAKIGNYDPMSFTMGFGARFFFN